MAQIFDRSANALARASLVLTGLIVIALGFTLDQLQYSPWVTKQGQRADQPVPFSHKHHVMGLGLQCQYCHTSVEKSSYAGIPPTKTCMNCHAQIWTNAGLLQPVRTSWATGESIPWIKIHDLPDFVYFNHEIHVNKGIGCSSCHGRVDLMPLMYQQNTPADGVVPKLPSQSGQEPAPHQRDLQHGLGRAHQPEASLVRECRIERWCTHGADGELHYGRSQQDRRPGGLARYAWIAWASCERSAGDDDSGKPGVREADRSGLARQISDQAVPHSAATGIEQLRDMPSMSETKGKKQELTLEAARAKLAGQQGKTYWRSVDELADTPEFREMVEREFPEQTAEWIDPVSRRGFLKVMSASLALAGLAG